MFHAHAIWSFNVEVPPEYPSKNEYLAFWPPRQTYVRETNSILWNALRLSGCDLRVESGSQKTETSETKPNLRAGETHKLENENENENENINRSHHENQNQNQNERFFRLTVAKHSFLNSRMRAFIPAPIFVFDGVRSRSAGIRWRRSRPSSCRPLFSPLPSRFHSPLTSFPALCNGKTASFAATSIPTRSPRSPQLILPSPQTILLSPQTAFLILQTILLFLQTAFLILQTILLSPLTTLLNLQTALSQSIVPPSPPFSLPRLPTFPLHFLSTPPSAPSGRSEAPRAACSSPCRCRSSSTRRFSLCGRRCLRSLAALRSSCCSSSCFPTNKRTHPRPARAARCRSTSAPPPRRRASPPCLRVIGFLSSVTLA